MKLRTKILGWALVAILSGAILPVLVIWALVIIVMEAAR